MSPRWAGAAGPGGSVTAVASVVLVAVFVGSGLAAAGPATGARAATEPMLSSSSVPSAASGPAAAATPEYGSPHPGILNSYELAPGGATSVDPAVAYDTVSEEPIDNVYETLVNYDGTSTASFVPTLAVCVPGTVQCTTDFGANLTGFLGGAPVDWTFVIDGQARFYDPATGASWGVYPTDAMFSVARALAFSDLPYVAKTPGWLLSQALLPFGSARFDGGLHAPYNTTPDAILGSMRVNDSTLCPASAIAHEHGCLTFVANGSGTVWPYFLALVANNLGGSVVPCGWFSYERAGMPGWGNRNRSVIDGGGPCLLPDGGNTTSSPAWTSYLASVGPYAWDAFENASEGWPAVDPQVQWSMVGSGPYDGAVIPGTTYQLRASPAYRPPSGCSGAGGVATYAGYCDPAVGAYQPTVNVYWESSQPPGVGAINAQTADLLNYIPSCAPLPSCFFRHSYNLEVFSTLEQQFSGLGLLWDRTVYTSEFPAAPIPTIPADFFTDVGVREFYVHAFPYTTVERTVDTVDGVPHVQMAGGPIPLGMGNYYPVNVSFPAGDPDPSPADTGGAAWWWAQVNDPASAYYDPELAACAVATPCTWPIATVDGAPDLAAEAQDWIAEVRSISSGALRPFQLNLTFTQYLDLIVVPSSGNPLPSVLGFGWVPDFPEPTDYLTPEISPHGLYATIDSFASQVGYGAQSAGNISACGHYGASFADLVFWAHAAANPGAGRLSSTCQGIAYSDAVDGIRAAANLTNPAAQVLEYNLVEQITNGLGMYAWLGQDNAFEEAAPWIDLGSLNTNPMIGGSEDQLYFQIAYAPYEQTVTFRETGLPLGSHFTVSAGAPIQLHDSSNVTAGGATAEFLAPNGTLTFSISAPAGYGVARVTGPAGTTYGSAVIVRSTVITLHFGALQPVVFSETLDATWPGLAAGVAWTVTLTPTSVRGAPGGTASNLSTGTGASIAFLEPVGAHFHFAVGKPSLYRFGGAKHGALTVPDHPLVKSVKFRLLTETVVFHERGLAPGTAWSVRLTGPLPLSTVTVVNSSRGSAEAALPNGSYSFYVPAVGVDNPTPSIGTVTILAPGHLSVRVVFVPGPAGRPDPSAALPPAALLSRCPPAAVPLLGGAPDEVIV